MNNKITMDENTIRILKCDDRYFNVNQDVKREKGE